MEGGIDQVKLAEDTYSSDLDVTHEGATILLIGGGGGEGGLKLWRRLIISFTSHMQNFFHTAPQILYFSLYVEINIYFIFW